MNRRQLLKLTAGAGVLGGASYLAYTERPQPADSSQAQVDADYYIAPDGDDSNPGTAQAPLRTLSAATSTVSPGELILLRGGVYEQTDMVKIKGLRGTSEAKITIAGHPEERPVFSFRGPTPGGWDYNDGLVFDSIAHVHVKNLTVRNSAKLGIELIGNSSHNVFSNITVKKNNLVGFGLYDGVNDNRLENIVAAHNYDRQNGGRDADGIQISNADGNRIEGAELYENSDDGLDLWESTDIHVEDVVSYRNGKGDRGDGNGFKLGGGGESGGQRIQRCVAFDNRQFGFNSNGAAIPIEVYNSTAWNNPTNYEFYDGEHELVNNIASRGEVSTNGPLVAENNTWTLRITRPKFRSTNPSSDSFLRLQAASPCVDAGVDVDGIDYTGSAPDLGAFEYDSVHSSTTSKSSARGSEY